MKSILILAILLVCIKANCQWVKVQPNGGCVMLTDSATNRATCSSIAFTIDNQNSKVTILSDGRAFRDYRYTQVKDQNGNNLASSFAELIAKLGEIQGTASYGASSTVSNVSFSCLSVTSETIYASGTYKEISIAPLNYGSYKLKTGSNAENTNITNVIDLKNEQGGLISTIITVTPLNGSTLLVCTKQ